MARSTLVKRAGGRGWWGVVGRGGGALGRSRSTLVKRAGGSGWPLISLATPHHMPIFDALALVRTPHLRGLATAQGDFHDLWPRTVARKLTTMGFLRHWGDVVFVNTIQSSQPSPTNCEAELDGGGIGTWGTKFP